jgi:hypothetical protein
MVVALVIAGCVLFGLFAGRWRALLAALPLGVLGSVLVEPWEVSELYVACVWAIFGGAAIAAGVAVRKLAGLVAGSREHGGARLS